MSVIGLFRNHQGLRGTDSVDYSNDEIDRGSVAWWVPLGERLRDSSKVKGTGNENIENIITTGEQKGGD
jgi:hypothetical protein